MKHIHIIGICGTFMAGIAALAKAEGYRVTGSDTGVYPPMSDVLDQLGVDYFDDYNPDHLSPKPDCVVVGNATKRGNPEFEYALTHKFNIISGPEWLYQHVLKDKVVIAVAGTHGKTTTSAMLAHCLKSVGEDPGYLIGGVVNDLPGTAYLGERYFVIEADEYDAALFDKRSKFIHYHPDYLILNNLEFDHADIFRDLDDIKRQFHHLLKTMPEAGVIAINAADDALASVLAQGVWSRVIKFNEASSWHAQLQSPDGSAFDVYRGEVKEASVHWSLMGEHNVSNALAVVSLLVEAGFGVADIVKALSTFRGVKRRMEKIREDNDIVIYNDFAHHPTAIKTTLNGLRQKVGQTRIIAVLEFGSYTMREGVHSPARFLEALQGADELIVKTNASNDKTLLVLKEFFGDRLSIEPDAESVARAIKVKAKPGDTVLIMSNTGFGGLYDLI